jgi:HAT1-interacting factor 1
VKLQQREDLHTNMRSSAGSSKSNGKAAPRFVFGGDAEESDEEEEAGATAAKGENGEDEDDDDLGLAFSILELARIGYEKALEAEKTATLKTIEGEEWNAVMIKSQLAEVLNHLADVGLESGESDDDVLDHKLISF